MARLNVGQRTAKQNAEAAAEAAADAEKQGAKLVEKDGKVFAHTATQNGLTIITRIK